MSTIKRVPLDFDHPLNKTWPGYVPPPTQQVYCKPCEGFGQTHAGTWLQRIVQRLSMLAQDVRDQERGKPMHPWLANDPYPATAGNIHPPMIVRPSPDMVDLVNGLAKGDVSIFGPSEGNIWHSIVEAAGLPKDFGTCKVCDGHGRTEAYPGQRAEEDAWKPTEPPTGEGWQRWEFVGYGSPTSPVFATPEGLAEWLCTPAAKWGASGPLSSPEVALRMVLAGGGGNGIMMTSDGGAVSLDEMVGRE